MIIKANVVAILAKEFGIGDFNLATRDDKKMANALKTMFLCFDHFSKLFHFHEV